MHDVALAYRIMRNRAASIHELALTVFRKRISYDWLWALDGVSVTVAPGELLAVVGPNGAGKTTLLKLVARVLPPTRGRVVVRGLTAPIIELGAGFNPELTGRENTVLYGAILGHDPNWIRDHVDEIADYAGLSDFMDAPLRTYSSGMIARLAFAIATIGSPEVLLIDEVLAVGDEEFRIRSQARIEEMITRGTAVLLVTHALEHVREMADSALWLDHGKAMAYGDPNDVVDAYTSTVAEAEEVARS